MKPGCIYHSAEFEIPIQVSHEMQVCMLSAYRQLPGSFLGHTRFFKSCKNWALQAWSWTEWHKNFSWHMLKEIINCQLIFPSLGGGKLHAFGKASFVLTIPAMVFGNSWEAATVGQEPLCCVTGCPFLYPCFLQVFHVLSEEVLYLRYQKYSWCSYSPCNLGYYPWEYPSGELGTGRHGEKKRNAFFFKSLKKIFVHWMLFSARLPGTFCEESSAWINFQLML